MNEDHHDGLCSICGHIGRFVRGDARSVRESYACPSCRFPLRWRDQAGVIVDEFGRGAAVSLSQLVKDGFLDELRIFEPALRGPFAARMKGLPEYVQSYFWPDREPGAVGPEGIRNEDITALSFDDDSFDLIISSDVLEHLYDFEAAFAETLRVLRPGGIHVFSIPNAYPFPQATQRRVELRDGEEVHVLPERYHVSGDGSPCLVYADYGADLTSMISSLGGRLAVVRRSSAVAPCHVNATFVMRKLAGSGGRRPRPAPVRSAEPVTAAIAQSPETAPQPVAEPIQIVAAEPGTAPEMECPICGGTTFEDFNSRANARCSTCRGVERNRLMWMLMEKLGGFEPGKRVLHLAPELGLARRLHDLSGPLYDARDIDPDRYRSQVINVTRLDLCTDLGGIPDASYDLILHNHVLEHLPCDVDHVLRELDRILAPGGLHFFSVPVRGEETIEDLSEDLTETHRLMRFGQEDHYRIFGASSLPKQLHEIWGPGKHLIEPLDLLGPDQLRRAGIPTVAWQGVTSHAIFHYRKGGRPPAEELVEARRANPV